jgi:3-oxoacyl-[acyl-carrier-protein] synthase-3
MARPASTSPSRPRRGAPSRPPASIPSDIDLIIVATTTPDQIFPSNACLLQHRSTSTAARRSTSRRSAPVSSTRWVSPISSSAPAARGGAGGGRRDLLAHHRLDRPRHLRAVRRRRGAVVIGADDEPGIISSHLHADGAYRELLQVPAGVGNGAHGSPYMEMKGNEVFRVAVTRSGASSTRPWTPTA